MSPLFLLLLWLVWTCPGACLDQSSLLLCPAARPPVEVKQKRRAGATQYKEGWGRRWEGTRMQRWGEKKLATKSLQLRSEGTFYLLIRTEQSRCSLGPEHSVFSGLNPLCFSSRRSHTSGCLWTENSIQQPCRDFCQKDILTKLYLIFYNVTSNSKCLDKKSQALEKWNHMWARKREKMCPKLNR